MSNLASHQGPRLTHEVVTDADMSKESEHFQEAVIGKMGSNQIDFASEISKSGLPRGCADSVVSFDFASP